MPSEVRVQSQTSVNIGKAIPGIEKLIADRVRKYIRSNSFKILNIVEAYFLAGAQQMLATGRCRLNLFGNSIAVSLRKNIETSKLGMALSDPLKIGELGIDNPQFVLDQLKDTMYRALSTRTIVDGRSITVQFVFNPIKLIKLNPHPAKGASGISIDSWLQWIVGPKFDKKGSPGYGLVRVSDILNPRDSGTRKRSSGSMKIRRSLARSSRTYRIAGADAALMLKTKKSSGSGRGQLTSFKGTTGQSWRPRMIETNFWENWWRQNIPAFKELASAIASAVMQKMIQMAMR